MAPSSSTTHAWTAPDAEIFAYRHWAALGDMRAVLVAVHGLSGAAQDFEPLGRHLAPLGFSTYAPELRGQGNDPVVARRGDLDALETWYADLHAFLARVRARHPSRPIYLYGESMGAAILTRFLAQAGPGDQPAGLILASPVVALQQKPAAWITFIFRLLLSVRPTFRIDVRKLATKNEPAPRVTRDEAHVEWFRTAPHKLDVFTVRFFKCLYQLIDGCYAAAAHLQMPVLVVYAQHDIFIRPDLIRDFFERLAAIDKEIELYRESYHLLLHDHDRDAVLARVTHWLQARLQ